MEVPQALLFAVCPPHVFSLASVSVKASFLVVSLSWESEVLENEQMNFLRCLENDPVFLFERKIKIVVIMVAGF